MQAELAHLTLVLLTGVAALFVIGILVLVMCAGLGINPFKKKTTKFLLAFFGGLIGLSAILVLVNVATNISIIADAKLSQANVVLQSETLSKLIPIFLVAAAAIVAMIFVSTKLATDKKSKILRESVEQLLNQNQDLLEKISESLSKAQPEDYRNVSKLRKFLKDLRVGIPELNIIYAGKFEDKLALYHISHHYNYRERDKDDPFEHEYFSCTPNYDCEYLHKFFSGESAEIFQSSSENNFRIYVPIVGKHARFVMRFYEQDRFGKIGS